MSALSSSACRESIPGAFPLFMALIAVFTSSRDGGLMSMPSMSSDGGGFAGSSGSGRLRTSRKCWTHLSACSFSVVISFPCLSLTGVLWLVFCPQSCLVILYTKLSSPLAAACSASPANATTNALLSFSGALFHFFVFMLILFFSLCNKSW